MIMIDDDRLSVCPLRLQISLEEFSFEQILSGRRVIAYASENHYDESLFFVVKVQRGLSIIEEIVSVIWLNTIDFLEFTYLSIETG